MSAVIVTLPEGEVRGYLDARLVADNRVARIYRGDELLALYSITHAVSIEIVDDGDPRISTPDVLALDVTAPCEVNLAGEHALSLVEDGYVRVWQGVDFVRQPDGRIVVSEARDDNEAFLDGDGSGSYRLSCYRCGKSVAAEVTEDTSWK